MTFSGFISPKNRPGEISSKKSNKDLLKLVDQLGLEVVEDEFAETSQYDRWGP